MYVYTVYTHIFYIYIYSYIHTYIHIYYIYITQLHSVICNISLTVNHCLRPEETGQTYRTQTFL